MSPLIAERILRYGWGLVEGFEGHNPGNPLGTPSEPPRNPLGRVNK